MNKLVKTADLYECNVPYLKDLFAAIAEFVGGNFAIGDILGGLEDVLGDESTAAAE